MLTEYYSKKIESAGFYRIGRSRMFLVYGVVAIVLGVGCPVIDHVMFGNTQSLVRVVMWSVIMIALGVIMVIKDRKAPKDACVLDKEGLTVEENGVRRYGIKWKDVKTLLVTSSQLLAPPSKNFNFIAKSDRVLCIQMKDGSYQTCSLNNLSYNPLKLFAAINVLSQRNLCNPKEEERSFFKLTALAIVAAVGLVWYLSL